MQFINEKDEIFYTKPKHDRNGNPLLLNELSGINLRRLIVTVAVHQRIANNFRVGIDIHAV
jgi:hypothetical protein